MTAPRAMREICGQPSSTMKPITGQTPLLLVTTDRQHQAAEHHRDPEEDVGDPGQDESDPAEEAGQAAEHRPEDRDPSVAQTPTVIDDRAP